MSVPSKGEMVYAVVGWDFRVMPSHNIVAWRPLYRDNDNTPLSQATVGLYYGLSPREVEKLIAQLQAALPKLQMPPEQNHSAEKQ